MLCYTDPMYAHWVHVLFHPYTILAVGTLAGILLHKAYSLTFGTED